MKVKARAIRPAIIELRLFFVIRTVPPPMTVETNMETSMRWPNGVSSSSSSFSRWKASKEWESRNLFSSASIANSSLRQFSSSLSISLSFDPSGSSKLVIRFLNANVSKWFYSICLFKSDSSPHWLVDDALWLISVFYWFSCASSLSLSGY